MKLANSLFKFDEKIVSGDMHLIGTDEAGRGPGAGPVVAAAVCMQKPDRSLKKALIRLNDSKKLSESIREELFEIIVKNSIYEVVFGSVDEIEKTNILRASLGCMKKACEGVIKQLASKNASVIVDGNKLILGFEYPQKYIIKGDGKSASIAAASILAKVSRDRYMAELDREFPKYHWSKNKGYLTEEHLQAIDEFGVTIHHRKKFLEKHFAKQLSLF